MIVYSVESGPVTRRWLAGIVSSPSAAVDFLRRVFKDVRHQDLVKVPDMPDWWEISVVAPPLGAGQRTRILKFDITPQRVDPHIEAISRPITNRKGASGTSASPIKH